MPLLNDSPQKDDDFTLRWYRVRNRVRDEFGQRPDVNAMLFLIGMNEVGIVKEKWEKEEKLNLMHIAVCRLLAGDGYYVYTGDDEEGWPHYEAVKGLPPFSMKEQEELLKRRIVEYFEAL
ncbi:MAG: hypothetical protein JST76_15320 [Bacteroidetes bacterium]|nr:hypothetical protein [Bacteroidota bacterium]MBS1619889.1 hypothetical protein [Bacteroidota bacterium]